jgi:hypothetical protein
MGGVVSFPKTHGSKNLFYEKPKPIQKIDKAKDTRDESEYPNGFLLHQGGDG